MNSEEFGNYKKAIAIPVTVQLEITDICNMRCPMCITTDHRNNPKLPTLSVDFIFSSILRPLKKMGLDWLSLSGGEPTLSPYLLEVIRDARDLGYGIFLATNALSERVNTFENILQSIETGRSAIQISFDSLHEEEFNIIRGGNYYTPVVQNIKKIRQLLIDNNYSSLLAISVVIQEHNAKSFIDTIDFALSILQADRIIVQLRHDYRDVTPSNWRKLTPLILTPKARDSILRNGEILFNKSKNDPRIGVIGRNLDNWDAFLTCPTTIKQKCGSSKRIFIDPYGNLRGCIHSQILANLNDVTIDEYLNSHAYRKFLAFSEICNICIHGCAS